jgi:ssDNA thymidine ADP-ribosyltransferase DarT-like protein
MNEPAGGPPEHPKIYHITHVQNLAQIAANGVLLSDAAMIARGGPVQGIGLSTIKLRRLKELEVKSKPGTKVGEYVPFYLCPRSVMLYVIYRANHPELTYLGGQEPIVHLELDLRTVVRWADLNRRDWAFSLSNAGAYYAEFRSRLENLHELDWGAIASNDFRSAVVKEHKQAEFLVRESISLELIERIGVRSVANQALAANALDGLPRRPPIEVHREWYY